MSENVSICNLIQEADMVLVGIGEEFEAGMDTLESSRIYKRFMDKLLAENLKEEDYEWAYPFLLRGAVSEENVANNIKKAYSKLSKLLENKNYFVISMNMDSVLEDSELDSNRIVSPFGSYDRLQCVCGCDDTIYDGKEYIRDVLSCVESNKSLKSMNQKICPNCKREIIANTVNSERYLEKGYIEQWGKYQKWLMGTVNKKLLILELGVTMQYPKLIRWPFEKMASYNNKSTLVRVCNQFPYLTPETAEKGISIKNSAVEFVISLS